MDIDWLPIETAPKDKTILVSDGKEVDSAYWDYESWCAPHSCANSIPYEPTHWMDKPKPPKQDGYLCRAWITKNADTPEPGEVTFCN